MDRDLSAACQMFLIPSTIMFAALSNAGTEGLKVFIAAMGLLTALIWFNRVRLWKDLKPDDNKTAKMLSTLFIIAWLGVFAVHLYFGFTGGFMKTSAT